MTRKLELEQELERVRTCDPPGFLRDMAEEALLAQIARTPARRRSSIGYLTPEGRAKRIAAGLPEEEEAREVRPQVVGAMPLYALEDGSLVLPADPEPPAGEPEKA